MKFNDRTSTWANSPPEIYVISSKLLLELATDPCCVVAAARIEAMQQRRKKSDREAMKKFHFDTI
jgi:hypothetical protein